MRRQETSREIFVFPLIALLIFLVPVAGYRHLWQDEAETAERARSILAGGVPRVIDSQGRLSINAGGREIEEGTLHRYTPWGQFYAGALGLLAGESIHLSPDLSIRLPFVAAHAVSSTLVGYGLFALAGLPALPAALIGGAFGLQTVRILHNRTCRYHALLDLFFTLGILGLGLVTRGRKRLGSVLLALAIFALPQIHTLGGSLLASLLALAAVLSSLLLEHPGGAWKAARKPLVNALTENFGRALLPGMCSLAVLLILTRPWLQTAWSQGGGPHEFRSIRSGFEIAYAFYIYAAAVLYLFVRGERRLAASLGLLLGYVFLASRLLDLHPFSQSRYYLSLPIFFLFWPIALDWPAHRRPSPGVLTGVLLLGIALPELQGVIAPWHGVRVVAADWQHSLHGDEQPLRQAFATITHTLDSGAVLVDYVPQLANWYLPDRPIALMPDAATRTHLNAGNPVWQRQLLEPEWHIAYLTSYNGQWNCSPNCDAHSSGYGPAVTRYTLSSKRLSRDFEMCIVSRWPTDRWNNAPFTEYATESIHPEGPHHDELTLARRCR